MNQRVLVIGGGPAGSMAAIGLARRGIDTLVFEANRFAGTKLVETLYPEAAALLASFGLPMPESTPARARFVGSNGRIRLRVALEGSFGAVDRNRLDTDLRKAAAAAGAKFADARVEDIDLRDDGVQVSAGGERHDGAFAIDASGKNPVSMKNRETQTGQGVLDRRVGAFSHFERPGGFDLDEIAIVAIDGGFGYALPINENRICVGISIYAAVVGGAIDEVYWDALGRCPFLTALIDGADRVLPVLPVKNCESAHSPIEGDRLLRVGDALGFRDPFLTDGLSFALETGHEAARLCAESISLRRPEFHSYPAFVKRIDAHGRIRAQVDRDREAALFQPAMAVDPHVSPLLRGCLFALAGGGAQGWSALREDLNAGRATP